MSAIMRAFALPLLLLLLAGCGREGDARPQNTAPPAKATRVEVVELTPAALDESFTLPGSLEAWEDLTLAAEYAGTVRWIGPKEGDRVRAGQEILRIDDDQARAALTRDQTAFEVAEKALERYRRLLAEQLVSQQEYDAALSRYEAARAALRLSAIAVQKSSLKSPIDGILDRLLVDRGEYVGIGDPLAVLVQVDRLKLLVDVPEKDVAFLRPGQQVEVLPAHPGQPEAAALQGEILHVAFQAEPTSRTFRVKIAVGNSDGNLRPGMIVRARFLRHQHQGVLAVPLFAVVDRDNHKYVFVAEDGHARRRPVELGPVVGNRVIITGGLSSGERLIVRGQQLLTDNALIETGEN